MDRVAKRFLIAGKVQGVFFRASTRLQAARHGIRGWALNLDDGRVEVLAVGPEAGVTALGRWLEHGPAAARVASVQVLPADAGAYASLTDFSCR